MAPKSSKMTDTYTFPEKSKFESDINGKKTELIELRNSNDMRVFITNYGARIVGIYLPVEKDRWIDVNLGHATIDEYRREKANYYGVVIGRVCGRIRDAQFEIAGEKFVLQPNNGDVFLHSGENAFHTKVFEVEEKSNDKVVLNYKSPDGEEGFPGNLELKVMYQLTEENSLNLQFEAVSDKTTPFNVTNHAFFNLNGEGSGTILDHELTVFTDQFLPAGADILPTGEIRSVENTIFDFTKTKKIGKDIDADSQQLKYGSGYDHTFVMKKKMSSELLHAARVKGDKTGIIMDVYTDQPGVHLYTGNFMGSDFDLKTGAKDERRTAFCLETQHLTDAMNIPEFPSILLEPGKRFKSYTNFRFTF